MDIRLPSALAAIALTGWSCQPRGIGSEPSTVNPKIAGYYQEAMSHPKADAALKQAFGADPKNAYTVYLQAGRAADRGDLAEALGLLETGNALPYAVVYTATPPPQDARGSIVKLLPLYASLSESSSLGTRQPEYFAALRAAGVRIAGSKPGGAIEFLTGARLTVATFKVESAYWAEQEDPARESAAKAKYEEFGKWFRDSSQSVSAAVRAAKQEGPAGIYLAELGAVQKALAAMPSLR